MCVRLWGAGVLGFGGGDFWQGRIMRDDCGEGKITAAKTLAAAALAGRRKPSDVCQQAFVTACYTSADRRQVRGV